jgi:hypothetical protein
MSKRWVLIVAVSKYHNGRMDLEGVTDDADRFRDTLRRHSDVREFVDIRDGEATKERILAALEYIADQADATDQIVVYFAGHGHRVRRADRYEYFLLPHDATFDTASTLGIHPSDLAGALNRGNARACEFILIVDCCRSGGFGGNFHCEAAEKVFPGLRDNWQNVYVAAATCSYQSAGETDRGGFFTQALCDALSHPELCDPDGRISVQIACAWAAASATYNAKLHRHTQDCVMSTTAELLFLTQLTTSMVRGFLSDRDFLHQIMAGHERESQYDVTLVRVTGIGSRKATVVPLGKALNDFPRLILQTPHVSELSLSVRRWSVAASPDVVGAIPAFVHEDS